MPRNVQIVSQTPNSITLSWDTPEDLGGRSDIVYVLWYQEGTSTPIRSTVVNVTVGTINGRYSQFVASRSWFVYVCMVFVELRTFVLVHIKNAGI